MLTPAPAGMAEAPDTRLLGYGVAAACVGVLLAALQPALADGRLAVVFVLAAVPAAFVIVKPRWVAPLFIALVWASADQHLPHISASVGSFSLPAVSPVQLGIVVLLGAAIVAALRRPADASIPLLVVVLLALPLIGAGLASSQGARLPLKDLGELVFVLIPGLVVRGAHDADRAAVALCALGAALGAGAVFSVAVHPTSLFALNETNFAAGDAARAAGPFGESNFFALSLAALLPLAAHLLLRGGWRAWVGVLAGPLVLAGVLATGSRGACLAAVVGSVFFAAVSGSRTVRWCVAALIGCGLALLPLFGGQAQTSRARAVGGRLTENRIALAMFADRPVLGVGPDRYRERYSGYSRRMGDDPRPVREAHSLPLEIAAEQGLAGLLGWLAAGVAIAAAVARRRVWRQPVGRALVAALVTYGVGSLFLHGSQLRLPFMLAGLLLSVGADAAPLWRSGVRS